MQRNWDVIRKILLRIEELPTGKSLMPGNFADDGIDKDTATFHMRIMIERGFVIGPCIPDSPMCSVQRLTWEGCEFLDNIRKDPVWEKVKQITKKRGLDLTFDVISSTAKSIINSLL